MGSKKAKSPIKAKNSKNKCLTKITNFIKGLSLGKYKTVLYFNGRSSTSSVVGGLISIAFYLIFIIYSVNVIKGIVNREHQNLDETARPF